MSVLIKNMEMPNSCLDCPCNLNLFFCKVCGGREVTDQTSITTKNDVITVTKPDWCPLVEHGECKNVTRAKREGVQFFAENGSVIQHIKDTVTDIQKEELMGDSTRLVSACGDKR